MLAASRKQGVTAGLDHDPYYPGIVVFDITDTGAYFGGFLAFLMFFYWLVENVINKLVTYYL